VCHAVVEQRTAWKEVMLPANLQITLGKQKTLGQETRSLKRKMSLNLDVEEMA